MNPFPAVLLKLFIAAALVSFSLHSFSQSISNSKPDDTIGSGLDKLQPTRPGMNTSGVKKDADPFEKLESQLPPPGQKRGVVSTNDPFAAADKEIQADIAQKKEKKVHAERAELAQQVCKATFDAQTQCMARTCSAEPPEQVCVRREQDPSNGCNNPGGGCLLIRTYSCVEFGVNPKYKEWQACMTAPSPSLSSCTKNGKAIKSVDACVSETLAKDRLVQPPPAVAAESSSQSAATIKDSAKIDGGLSKVRNYNNYATDPRDLQPSNSSAARDGDRGEKSRPVDKAMPGEDINEPSHDFRGRIWLEGGGRRRPASSRIEACQQAERDREVTIKINARDSRDRGVEERSECTCSYKALTKEWYCRVYILPVGHSPRGNSK